MKKIIVLLLLCLYACKPLPPPQEKYTVFVGSTVFSVGYHTDVFEQDSTTGLVKIQDKDRGGILLVAKDKIKEVRINH